MVEAGTGVGKTYAYLVPVLLSGQRALVSTATKALQDQLFSRDIPKLIEYASAWYTLHPGDVILTGTPDGVGPVKPGDTIFARIEKIGEFRMRVADQYAE